MEFVCGDSGYMVSALVYIWDSKACICIVGFFTRMSLSGLQSCVDILRLVIFRGGGYMNLLSLSDYN